jgi:hypothetical protein
MFLKNLLSILLYLTCAVILLGLFYYIIYGEIFTPVHCSGPDNIRGHVINQDLLWARLTYSNPASGVVYDITNMNVFLNLVNNNPVEYIVTHVNGNLVQAVRVDNSTYTVNPNIVKDAVRFGLFNFHWY